MSINLINYALAKKDWEKAYEDLKVLGVGGRNYVIGNPEHNSVGSGYAREFSVSKDLVNDFNTSEKKSFTMSCDIEINNATPHPSLPGYLRIGFEISLYDTKGTRHIFHCHYFPEQGETNKFRFTKTFNFDFEITETTQSNIYTQVENGKVSKLKIELGNKATPWTPAPEDINAHPFVAELAESVFRSKQNEERIQNLENAITALGGGS